MSSLAQAHKPELTGKGTLADWLVEALVSADIRAFFGVPGGAIEPFYNALARAQGRALVSVITTRSEAGAGFAADGYQRASGQMAVCTATTGPGISNLLTAVMTAHADRIPMLVLTPQVSLPKHGRGALQDSSDDGYDMVRMLKSCTVYSSAITHPDQLPHKLSRALRRAQSAPSGPVHLSIPSDVLASASNGEHLRWGRVDHVERALPLDDLRELWAALKHAERPVFYVGDDGGPEAHKLGHVARALGGALISSPAGKRWVEHIDPSFAGVLGFSGHPGALTALREADLVVAFGATFDELSTNAWSALPTSATWCIDRHPDFSYRVPHARMLVAELDAAICWMAAQPTGVSETSAASRVRPDPEDSALRPPTHGARGPVHPADLMYWLGSALPDHVVVHVDSGNSFSWSTRALVRPRADTYRVAMGFCSMAWAISAALGAAVATGERTVCVTGDGAMLMSSLELSVAVQENLPVTYIILNDGGFGMVRHGQRLAQAASIGHEISDVRFDRIAEACGAPGLRVHGFADLARVPREYLSSAGAGPFLLDVMIDREAVPPMADRVLGLATGVPK